MPRGMSTYCLVLLPLLFVGPAAGSNSTPYYTGGKPGYRLSDTTIYNGTGYGTTNRTGVSSSPGLPMPAPLEGIPYAPNLTVGTVVDYTVPAIPNHPRFNASADSAVLGASVDGKGACSGRGFLCDFSEQYKLKGYGPLDFVWKVVDPLDYGKHSYNMRTLNCEVQITASSDNGVQNYDYFYVPLGQENVGSFDYCDVEAIRRKINDADLNMTDQIRVRGETARLNNKENTLYDLIGEQFDLVCKCTTKLSTEASVGANLASSSLLTAMMADGQRRQMMVELRLFADDMLMREIRPTYNFPTEASVMYLLTRQLHDNDWDFQLQINRCVVCWPGVPHCNTTIGSNNSITIYDQCDRIAPHGPLIRFPSNSSWYKNSSIPHDDFKPLDRWSKKNPAQCPYHVVGFAKFKLTGMNQMIVTCAITGCSTRPCSPCTATTSNGARRKRSLLAREYQWRQRERMLQEAGMGRGGSVDLGMTINFDDADDAKAGKNQGNNKNNSKKSAKTNFMLILILLAMVLLAVILIRRTMKKHAHMAEEKKVLPNEEEHKNPLGQDSPS